MNYIGEALAFTVGLLLMFVTSIGALEDLLTRSFAWWFVDPGAVAALVNMFLFGIALLIAVLALFSALETRGPSTGR